MALNKPTGTETHKAINEIKKVPAKRGIAPYWDKPCWPDPALSAPSNCGFHTVPNKNSSIGISVKKRTDSNTTEKIIATVVKMAMTELAASNLIIIFSTAFLDLKF